MSWIIEHLHRDGSVHARVRVPENPSAPDAATSFRIGRALDNDFVLDDEHCAPYHARLDIATDGSARLFDLGSENGIIAGRNKRAAVHEIRSAEPLRLGETLIRVRSSAWPLAPERRLTRIIVWPFALLVFVLVLTHGAWDVWLRDVQEKSPQYLYELSALAAGLCVWSSAYALFGRLVSGVERFFSHLLIASTGYLCGTLILSGLNMLAFSASWLWPVRITEPVVVIVAALTVRFHLRLADPRHWPSLRIGLALVAALAIAIPLMQRWVIHTRLTDVDTLYTVEYPALRLAEPVPLREFSASAETLKVRADKARKKDDNDSDNYGSWGGDGLGQ
jgi:pSer/pThr/pTyr-binding forkhead associated (FHA) protein